MRELVVREKGSFSDFHQCISKRTIGVAKKRSIKENIAYKNGSYDFSMLNGEITFEERDLTYAFDIIGIDMFEVEKQKSEILDWLSMVHDEDIYDPYTKNYHFHGSFDSFSWSENWEQNELSVTFKVYPYKIANSPIKKSFNLLEGENTIKLFNGGSHQIVPTIITNEKLIIQKDDITYSINKGTYTDDIFVLNKGENKLIVTTPSSQSKIEFEFVEEVL